MRKLKKLLVGMSTVVVLLLTNKVVLADEFDDKIAEQRAKLQQIEASKLSQSATLSSLVAEQETVSGQITTVQAEIEQTQAELANLMNDISDLEEMIAKRDVRIREQARQLQTIDSAANMLDALFSSDSIVEALSKIHAMSQITGQSLEILEKQKTDKELLVEKQTTIEQKAQEQQTNIARLSELKQNLATSVTAAQVALVDLELSQAKTQEQIDSLSAQKAEAERLRQEAAARLAAQQEAERQARLAAQQAAAQQAAAQAAAQAQAQRQAQQAQTVTSSSTTSTSSASTTTSTASATPTTTTTSAASSSGFTLPIPNPTITSWFGEARTIGSYSDVHRGVDFVNGDNRAPIRAIGAGTVVFSGTSSGGGLTVVLKHANGMYSYYLHMSSLAVSVGQTVSQGQQVGIIGTTGISTGIHLHLAMSTSMWSGYVNPMNYLR